MAQPGGPGLVRVVVEADGQRAAALAARDGKRLLDAAAGQRRFERGDVGRAVERQRAGLRLHRAAPGHLPEPEQRLAQVGAGLTVVEPGPQQGRDLGARHPAAAPREQHDELAAALERQRPGLAGLLDGRHAEQAQMKCGVAHGGAKYGRGGTRVQRGVADHAAPVVQPHPETLPCPL